MIRLKSYLSNLKHRWGLRRIMVNRDAAYRNYLAMQLNRSLNKQRHQAKRVQLLIDRLIETGSPSPDASVLCIGCRNTTEIDYFRYKGFSNVRGIDLFSNSPDILTMDMHYMTFPDASFDVIFSSHSLEHAYEVKRVIQEIVRVSRPGALVAIEVPVKYMVRGCDLVDFESASNLHAAFGNALGQVLYSEEVSLHPDSPDGKGMTVVRTVFTIRKPHQTQEERTETE